MYEGGGETAAAVMELEGPAGFRLLLQQLGFVVTVLKLSRQQVPQFQVLLLILLHVNVKHGQK